MDQIKLVSKKLRCQGKWISFYAASMSLPDGKTAEWDYIHHNGAAAMVAEDKDGRILMIKQYRPGVDKEILEIPAGGINPKEEPKAAAIRELREETGALCNDIFPLLELNPSPAYNDETVFIFAGKVESYTELQLDENEYVSLVRFSIEDLIKKIESGEITDSKTIAGIFMYREQKEKNGGMRL